MLWQPQLPDAYLTLPKEALAQRIAAHRKALGNDLIILGHHYQTDEVIQHADFTGDSLKLSQLAASAVKERGARFVVFCGVHFMAETADLLAPEGTAVILPDLSAGCSMADMADYDDALSAWKALHDTLAQEPHPARVIPITYVNSTAAIKAFVGQHGGAVCTSSNAAAVLEWAFNGGDTPTPRPSRSKKTPSPPVKVLFLPDQHLGRNTAAKLGLDTATQTCLYDPRLTRVGEPLGGATPDQVAAARVILWAGHCSVHKLFRPEHVHALRTAEKDLPKAERTRVIVHPECAKEVVDLADDNGSTEYIIRTIDAAKPGSRWAIGTEVHLVTRLARRAAQRGVHARILSDCQCLCTTMYRIDQPHLLWTLDNLAEGRVVNRITVHPKARALALEALGRMLRLSDPPAGTAPSSPPSPASALAAMD
jgi:quinolinate synthase